MLITWCRIKTITADGDCLTFAYVIPRAEDDGSEILEKHEFELGMKECCIKWKYYANLLSFQNPKMFVCQQKQRNNCQVCYK